MSDDSHITAAERTAAGFVDEYYKLVAQGSYDSLLKFYGPTSAYSRGEAAREPEEKRSNTLYMGQTAINDKLVKYQQELGQFKIRVCQIDSQVGISSTVLVVVSGYFLFEAAPGARRFYHTFVLAPNGPHYYVVNDCLRFFPLEEIVIPQAAAPAPVPAPVVAQPQAPKEKPVEEKPESPKPRPVQSKKQPAQQQQQQVAPQPVIESPAVAPASPKGEVAPKPQAPAPTTGVKSWVNIVNKPASTATAPQYRAPTPPPAPLSATPAAVTKHSYILKGLSEKASKEDITKGLQSILGQGHILEIRNLAASKAIAFLDVDVDLLGEKESIVVDVSGKKANLQAATEKEAPAANAAKGSKKTK